MGANWRLGYCTTSFYKPPKLTVFSPSLSGPMLRTGQTSFPRALTPFTCSETNACPHKGAE